MDLSYRVWFRRQSTALTTNPRLKSQSHCVANMGSVFLRVSELVCQECSTHVLITRAHHDALTVGTAILPNEVEFVQARQGVVATRLGRQRHSEVRAQSAR